MENSYLMVAAATVFASALVAVIVAIILRSSPQTSPKEMADLQQRLAVAQERAARLPGVEADLKERSAALERLAAGKASIERELASSRQALLGAENRLAEETDLRQRLGDAVETLRSEKGALEGKLAILEERVAQERKRSEERLAEVQENEDRLKQEFRALATETNESVLAPLREQIQLFQHEIQTAHHESGKERVRLEEQMRELSKASGEMNATNAGVQREAARLSNALKGQSQMRGAWGEMVLETVLRNAALRPGMEYVAQQTHVTEEGDRLRPDVIINLPSGDCIAVDSKVSLVAFESYINAEAKEDREKALENHRKSLRGHIANLSSKAYHSVASDNFNYAILFVPNEGALAPVLDEELLALAADKGVMLATPTTLLIALRTVKNLWLVEDRNRNAEAIAEKAGQLYDKMAGFVGDMLGLGRQLEKASDSYSKAMGKLSKGKANAIGYLESLRNMGAKTTTTYPETFDFDREEDGPEAARAAGA